MGVKKDCPCHGCGDRVAEPNCHGTCERYAAFKERVEAENAARRDAKAANNEYVEYNVDKARRKYRQHGWNTARER